MRSCERMQKDAKGCKSERCSLRIQRLHCSRLWCGPHSLPGLPKGKSPARQPEQSVNINRYTDILYIGSSRSQGKHCCCMFFVLCVLLYVLVYSSAVENLKKKLWQCGRGCDAAIPGLEVGATKCCFTGDQASSSIHRLTTSLWWSSQASKSVSDMLLQHPLFFTTQDLSNDVKGCSVKIPMFQLIQMDGACISPWRWLTRTLEPLYRGTILSQKAPSVKTPLPLHGSSCNGAFQRNKDTKYDILFEKIIQKETTQTTGVSWAAEHGVEHESSIPCAPMAYGSLRSSLLSEVAFCFSSLGPVSKALHSLYIQYQSISSKYPFDIFDSLLHCC